MAVYTAVDDDALAAFLADYDLGAPMAFKGIAEGVENSNYLLRTEAGEYILTLYEKRVAPADLPFFLGLMEHLAANGAPCPVPVKARDGEALRELCGRPAAIITFLPGLSPRRVDLQHCAELGAGLARLHLAADGFALSRANDLGLAGWRALFADAGPAAAASFSPALRDELAADLDALSAVWPADGALPRGVIHADLFPDNAFFAGRGAESRLSGIIDFYFACEDVVAYDLAICVTAWCFETDGAFNATKAMRLTAGYARERPLRPEERAALPVLCRGAAMRFALTRLYDWVNTPDSAMVTRKDPTPYVRRLRFHRAAIGPEAYGL
ncbi:MAG: homoserine kinase [Pseudomonadota bacterium]